jgi:hypothetical protein
MDDRETIPKDEHHSFGDHRHLHAEEAANSSTCILLLLLLSYLAAVSVAHVEVIWSLLGSTAGLWLLFTMPTAFHL